MNSRQTETHELRTLPPHQRRFVTEHATCPMCEGDLKISHDIDKNQNKVKELAYCGQCQLRARSAVYNLN